MTVDLTNHGRSAFYLWIRSVSGRKMFMIAYTAWDSLQTIAQQYDADLVLVPGERLGLMRRRDQSAPRPPRTASASVCALDSRLCKPHRDGALSEWSTTCRTRRRAEGERMNAAEREALIDQYEDGFRVVSVALDAITEAELEAREAPGEWSSREIVHHLADSEMTSAIRLRLLIAEDAPTLLGYDQEAFVRSLYPDRPIEPSLAAFEAARAATVPILRRLSEEQWQRAGTHSESGRYTVEDWLHIYSGHAHDHSDQIRRARATVAG